MCNMGLMSLLVDARSFASNGGRAILRRLHLVHMFTTVVVSPLSCSLVSD